jgi:poly(3-hydroxybutyrate) depolymerase
MASYKTAVLIAGVACWAMAQEVRVTTHRSAIDQSDQPYALYLPKDFSRAKRYPLLVSLHGAGGDHRTGMRQVIGDWDRPRDLPFVIVAPLGRGSLGYLGIGDRDVLEVMAHAEATLPLDRARYYLTGVSMGGSGSYHLLARYRGLFAAGIVVCGMRPSSVRRDARVLGQTPLWLFHGDKDDQVPVAESREVYGTLREGNPWLNYTEFAGDGHNITAKAYAGGEWAAWLLRFERAETPIPAHRPLEGLPAVWSERATYVHDSGTAEIALEASRWGGLKAQPAIHHPLASHEEGLPGGPLVVFGTVAANPALAKLEARLPLRLKRVAAGRYGLLFTSVLEGRRITVCSGAPWWDRQALAADRGFRWQWMSLPYRKLEGLPDWVLYDGHVGNVMASGSWDDAGRIKEADRFVLEALGKTELQQ